MNAIHSLAVPGNVTYFKMIDDVDMTGMTGSYSPVNENISDYTQVVDFDGNNKTISNLGKAMFYVLKGSVYDLTFDSCSVTTRGILAEYIQGSGHSVTNVIVSNGSVNNSNANVGGLIGCINNGTSADAVTATITDCTVSDTDVTGAGVVAGLVGFADAKVNISGCTYIGGTVTSSARFCGGMIGSTGNYNSVISDCQVHGATVMCSVSNNDFRAGGFVGQLQTKVTIKGCSVVSSTLNLSAPTSGKVYNSGGYVGVCYGTITKNDDDTRSSAEISIIAGNTVGTGDINLGGFAGYNTGAIRYSDATVSASSITGSRIGGFVGYALQNSVIEYCTSAGTISGTQKTGGFVGVAENGTMTGCSASTMVTKVGSTSGTGNGCDFGGFVGEVTQTVTLTKCSAHGTVSVNSSYDGGFAGSINPVASKTATISKCWSTGNVTSSSSQSGGFIGHIAADASGTVIINDCYETGNLTGGNQRKGGLIGQINSGIVTIARCYATGSLTAGSFAQGGLVGYMNAGATIEDCAAWNSTVTAGSVGSGNWSSGAVIGVAYPSSTRIANNFRNPDMELTAFWGNVSGYTFELLDDYDHADVDGSSTSTYLIVKDKSTGVEAASTTANLSGGNYPIFPYHGKHSSTNRLSTLASTAKASGGLGWSSDVWDFSGPLPLLK